ncbi:TonB-dependent siderophore receptor [Pigmentiphaga aceris]|nr:TonB-dependent receptor [Pigmentiphaga aceris]
MILALQFAMAGLTLGAAVWTTDSQAQGMAAASGQASNPASNQARQYNIPAGPLTSALNRFAEETGIFLTAPGELTQGKTSQGLRGTHGVSAAFNALLAGTGLQAVQQADGAYSLRAAPPVVQGAPAVSALPAVTVSADVTHSRAVSQGTGSYTLAKTTRSAMGMDLSLRDTPQSVTVISRQRIEDQGLRTPEDALANTTGVSLYQGDSDRSLPYSRGFALQNYVVDGVSYAGNNNLADHLTSLAMYDRVEIIRGPTGMVSSFGDPAGVLSFVRKRATSRVVTGTASLTLGRWDSVNPSFDISTPLNKEGSVRARFVADYLDEDSFMDRHHRTRQLYYGTIEADLTDRTTVTLGVDSGSNRIKGVTFGSFPSRFTNGAPVPMRRGMSSAPEWAYWENESLNAFGRVEHKFDNGWRGETTLQLQRRSWDAETLYLLNRGLNQQTGLGLAPLLDQERNRASELYWNASANGPFSLFGRTHELNVGMSASRKWTQRDYYGGVAAEPIGSIYEWDGSYAYPSAWRLNSRYDRRLNVKTADAFASARFSLSDAMHVIAGGRFNDWRGDRRHFQELTPYAGITYDLNETYTVYASYAELFNPQNVRTVEGVYLDPKVGKGYEVGAKAEFLDGRLLGALSLYRTLQDNTAEIIDGGFVRGSTERAYRAVSGIATRGIELDLGGELAAGWQAGVGLSVSRSEDRLGNTFNPHIPEQTAKLYTTYRLPGAWNKLTVGGGVRWQKGTYRNYSNAGTPARFDQGSVTVVDLMAKYDFNQAVSAQVNVSNLFDREYYSMTGQEVQYAQPMNVSVKVLARF